MFRIFTTGKASHCTSRENDAPDKSLAGDTQIGCSQNIWLSLEISENLSVNVIWMTVSAMHFEPTLLQWSGDLCEDHGLALDSPEVAEGLFLREGSAIAFCKDGENPLRRLRIVLQICLFYAAHSLPCHETAPSAASRKHRPWDGGSLPALSRACIRRRRCAQQPR